MKKWKHLLKAAMAVGVIAMTAVQICAAANDSEGLRYGTSGTTEKYYLEC